MSHKGTVINMASHGQRNNALWTTNIWPGHYSRDHCHTAKLSNGRESNNQDHSVSPGSCHLLHSTAGGQAHRHDKTATYENQNKNLYSTNIMLWWSVHWRMTDMVTRVQRNSDYYTVLLWIQTGGTIHSDKRADTQAVSCFEALHHCRVIYMG